MSSENGDRTAQPNEDPAAQNSHTLGGHTPGALLKQERIRRGLSVQQAAEGLHLDPWIVEAIEANHFLALGAPVYAKGYLRKFAVLLELAPDVVVARYEALSDTPAVPTPVPVITTTPPPRPKWPKRLAWSLVIVLIAVIGWFAFDVLMPPPAPIVPPQTQPAATATEHMVPATFETTQSAATPVAATTDAPATFAPTSAAAAAPRAGNDVMATPVDAPVPGPPATGSSGEGATQLRLEFSEASWVEVYDANGQRLLYDVGQPGRARNVSGPAPLSVVIGMASAVTAQVNDRKIVVPRRANKDSTRFVVGADGSVQ